MKVGIASGGLPKTTKVYNVETGETIAGVRRVEFVVGADSEIASAHLTVENPSAQLIAELKGITVHQDDSQLAHTLRLWLAQWREQVSGNAARALDEILSPFPRAYD